MVMKNRRSSLFWGVTLLLVGGFFLARNAGLIPDFADNVWTLILGAAALVFFFGYLLSGWHWRRRYRLKRSRSRQ